MSNSVVFYEGIYLHVIPVRMIVRMIVTYLGYRVSEEGVLPLSDKVGFIKNASSPQNISELKSVFGLTNYYHNHLPYQKGKSEMTIGERKKYF